MIKVWAEGGEAGLLDRLPNRRGERATAFGYLPEVAPTRAVSVTMPVRLSSWDSAPGLAPIFEMNLPEGALRERLRLAFAKATGSFDDFDLLSIVGRSQVGRIRYTGRHDVLNEQVPFQSVDEILSSRRGGNLFRYLVDKFAAHSGISGVQPKILVRDGSAISFQPGGPRLSDSYRGATHVVKFWEPLEFPQLAANEYFCLRAAELCGLTVPRYRLAEDGTALVVDRFDLRPDGSYRGLEDFCVLNARRTDEKYRGSYETAIVKRLQQFSNSSHVYNDLERLFKLIALNCAIRNGDAHLKNFAILYDSVLGEARLAPVYDLVTTSVYMPKDTMALTMNGSSQWPTAKELRRFGETRAGLAPAKTGQIFEQIAGGMAQALIELRSHIQEHSEFRDIGERMVEAWTIGMKFSLQNT